MMVACTSLMFNTVGHCRVQDPFASGEGQQSVSPYWYNIEGEKGNTVSNKHSTKGNFQVSVSQIMN